MLPFWHAFTFVSTFILLLVVFYRQRHQLQSTGYRYLFFISLAVYLYVLSAFDVSWSFKLSVITKDLLVMTGLSLLFMLFSRNKLGVWLYALVVSMGLSVWYLPDMLLAFSDNVEQRIIYDCDPQAELLLELKEGDKIDAIKSHLETYEIVATPAFDPADKEATELDDYYVLDVPNDRYKELAQLVEKLSAIEAVDWVEKNEIVNVAPQPAKKNPKQINKRFGVNDPELMHQWALEALGIDALYEMIRTQKLKPQRKARLFILDTGVDSQHEDLSSVYKSHDNKYDTDPMGHGTHCAGIAAAVSNNGKGVASLTPNNAFVEVTSIKVLSPIGTGSQKGIIGGIIEAADNGADVISLSLGGRSTRSRQRAYAQAVSYANRKGAIVVCAAGNSADDASSYAPANAPGVIAVAAIDEQLKKAGFSNHVRKIGMSLAAPGVNIRSTIPGNSYANYNGTSMATPYVSGILAVMKSLKPDLSTKEAHTILSTTGKRLSQHTEVGILPQADMAVQSLLK